MYSKQLYTYVPKPIYSGIQNYHGKYTLGGIYNLKYFQ